MHRTIIAASPRDNGKSAALATEIFEACIEDCPDDGVSVVSVPSIDVKPCNGCDGCKATCYLQQLETVVPEEGDPLEQTKVVADSDATLHQCVFHDDFAEVRKHIDAADELIVVSPVYFAGPPAQFKALLDRMQPYFWSNICSYTQHRRPITLHVIREGGDPYGYDALVDSVRSAFGVAGFRLETIFDWKDCFGVGDEIIREPEEYSVETLPSNTENETSAESNKSNKRPKLDLRNASKK